MEKKKENTLKFCSSSAKIDADRSGLNYNAKRNQSDGSAATRTLRQHKRKLDSDNRSTTFRGSAR
jgi:hypothetical protein